MKAHQLTKHQFALLGVLLLRSRTVGELKERWPYALRTLRSCIRHGLVHARVPFNARDHRTIVSLTNAGHELLSHNRSEAQ